LIFNLGVFDRLCVELEDTSVVAVEIETEELDITFEVEADIELDVGLEGPATGSIGSKNPANGADDADSWGFGMRLSTTGYLLQLSAAGTPGNPGLGAAFGNFAAEVGVADLRNKLEELGPASPDVRDGVGDVKQSWSGPFRGGGIVGLNPDEGPDESPVAVGVGVELTARVGSVGGGADVTRPPNSGSRGEKATGVTRVAALAERGFIGTAPFRRVGSAMRFVDTGACD
jgi:hypothetical protein